MSSFDLALARGAAQELVKYKPETYAVGGNESAPVGVYGSSATDLSETSVVVRSYPVDSSVADNDEVVGLQFAIESDSVDLAGQICDDLRALLHQSWNVTLGTVMVSQSFRRSGANSDSGGHSSRTENYYLTVNRPN